VIVACGVPHHHDAQSCFRVEAHHVPVAGTAAEMLDESGTLLVGLSGAEPAQSEVTLASPRCDLLHLRHRRRGEQSCLPYQPVVQVKVDQPCGVSDAPDQTPIGGTFDVERLERYVPPLPATNHAPLGNAALKTEMSAGRSGW
jgi:hypothetical protein